MTLQAVQPKPSVNRFNTKGVETNYYMYTPVALHLLLIPPLPRLPFKVRALGVNGFQLLCTMSDNFDQFGSLFAPESESRNREQLSKEDNVQLDAQLKSFFRHLSPFYQLPAAGKAMEWLVRRYQVQEYSVDAILRCVLPYHDTKLFVRSRKEEKKKNCNVKICILYNIITFFFFFFCYFFCVCHLHTLEQAGKFLHTSAVSVSTCHHLLLLSFSRSFSRPPTRPSSPPLIPLFH